MAGWLLWHLTPAPWDLPLSALPVLAAVVLCAGRIRRLTLVLGWLLSLWLLIGSERLPTWLWLLALGLLLLAYPLSAWRDAPVFPTPRGALDGVGRLLELPPGARLLDAGCGTGAGLIALRCAFPSAACEGIERSWPLMLWARLRCPWAVIFHGDIWRQDWSGYSLVYLFQRPESMPRAWNKAQQEMADGSWLVSLEFKVEGRKPHAGVPLPGGRTVWVYRLGGGAATVRSRQRSSRRGRQPISRETR